MRTSPGMQPPSPTIVNYVPPEAHPIALEHVDGETCGDTGIHGVAACFEYGEACVCGEIVSGRYHVPGSHDGHAGRSQGGVLFE